MGMKLEHSSRIAGCNKKQIHRLQVLSQDVSNLQHVGIKIGSKKFVIETEVAHSRSILSQGAADELC